MSKKAIVVLLLVLGLLAYGGYIFTILRPYFAKVELETAWELDYSSVTLSQMHIGDQGTIFLTTEDSGFIAISPGGQELYRYEIPSLGYSYGFDDGSNDTLWIATIDYVDPGQLPPGGQAQAPTPPGIVPPTPGGHIATQATYTARMTGIATDGSILLDQTFEVGGMVSNLWCTDGKVVFIAGQDLNCYDEQGNQLWVRNYPTMVDFTSCAGTLLFLDCGADVVALNTAGEELWRTSLGQGGGLADWHSWSSANGRLCLLDDYDYVHVLDFAGQEIWSAELPYSYGPFSGYNFSNTFAKIHADHTVYAMSGDATLRKYSAEGSSMWHFKVGQYSSEFSIGADGTVYIASESKGLLAISAGGKLLWRDENFGRDNYASPVVSDNGLLYLVQGDKLLALKIPAI